MGNRLYLFGAVVLVASPIFTSLFIKSSWVTAMLVFVGVLVGLGACVKGLGVSKKERL